MKSFSQTGFSIAKKYGRIKGLVMAYVWNLNRDQEAVTYALRYSEAVHLAETVGWTETHSWKQVGGYSTSKPSQELQKLLEPYRMVPQAWWKLVTSIRLPLPAPSPSG